VSGNDRQLERDALARLSRVQGPGQLRATILALIAPADNAASFVCWTEETQDAATAAVLREDVMQLTDAARLPCLEAMLQRMRACSKDDRRRLLESTRRVMAAFSPLRPIDRLHWLAMRRRLGERPPVAALPEAHNDLHKLPGMMVMRIAGVVAYLARMVPGPDDKAGQAAWYAAAMRAVIEAENVPPRAAPDGDGLAHALLEVEALPWMLRPVLLRAWVDAALATSQRARLRPMAADALRLVAGLLDSPLPPKLARHYVVLDWAPPAGTR
jgi:hypothetical protein